jgi:hypothetical protein
VTGSVSARADFRSRRRPDRRRSGRKGIGAFLHEHSLSLVSAAVLLLWILLYLPADPDTHAGAFFGNAIADWSGVVLVVIGTKFLYERGSKESKPVHGTEGKLKALLVEHSLSIAVAVSGLGWLAVFLHMRPTSKWGQVVGNVLSEWVQVLGIVLLTKRLFERGSEESKKTRGAGNRGD